MILERGNIQSRPSPVLFQGKISSGPPPFVPPVGCLYWGKTGALTGLANNDPVASFTDLSGNGNSLTQSTASARPLFKTGGANGEPYLIFDGVNDWLSKSFSLAQPCTLFLVCAGPILTNTTTIIDGTALFSANISKNGTTVAVQAGGALATQGGVVWTTPHVYAVKMNVSSSAIWYDGVANAKNLNNSSPGGIVMGSLSGFAQFAKVNIYEFLVFNSALSSVDIKYVNAYLGSEYAIAIAP